MKAHYQIKVFEIIDYSFTACSFKVGFIFQIDLLYHILWTHCLNIPRESECFRFLSFPLEQSRLYETLGYLERFLRMPFAINEVWRNFILRVNEMLHSCKWFKFNKKNFLNAPSISKTVQRQYYQVKKKT